MEAGLMGVLDDYINFEMREREDWEEFFSAILSDKVLGEKVAAACCFDLMEQWQPLAEYGEEYSCAFSMDGMIFAEDDCGGYFVLLSDGEIGYVNFAEDECGRVAETLRDLFELEVNCAFDWHNYLIKKYILNPSMLVKDVASLEAEGRDDFEDAYGDEMPEYDELQKELADKLHLKISSNIAEDVLPKLYRTVQKQPGFTAKSTATGASVRALIQ